jgi:hypothetical protein
MISYPAIENLKSICYCKYISENSIIFLKLRAGQSARTFFFKYVNE